MANQITFTTEPGGQLDQLRATLAERAAWPDTAEGKYAPAYNLVNSWIQSDPGVNAQTKLFFQQVGDINNNANVASNTYIRTITRAGLLYKNPTADLSKIQKTSNAIGEAIFDQILRDKGIPQLNDIIRHDVTNAIKTGGQTWAGWGGALFFLSEKVGSDPVAPKSLAKLIFENQKETEKFEAVVSIAVNKTLDDHGWALDFFPAFMQAASSAIKALVSPESDLVIEEKSQAVKSLAKILGETLISAHSNDSTALASALNEWLSPEILSAANLPSFGDGKLVIKVGEATGLQTAIAIADVWRDLASRLPINTIVIEGPNQTTAWFGTDTGSRFAVEGVSEGTVFAGGGNDLLIGGTSNDTLNGGTGDDQFIGGLGNDTYVHKAGDGNDVILDNALNGGDGLGKILYADLDLSGSKTQGTQTNIFTDGNGFTYEFGGRINQDGTTPDRGTLKITGTDGGTIIVQNFQNGELGINLQTIADTTIYANRNGTELADIELAATATYQKLFGLGGNDTMYVSYAENVAYGGDGEDIIRNGAGEQQLYGEAGRDVLIASEGIDQLSGGTEDDALQGGADDDYLEGNENNDVLAGGTGNDVLLGGTGDDILMGGGGAEAIDRTWSVAINQTNNTLTFNQFSGSFSLENDGSDLIKGEAGNDYLFGGESDDYLDGGDDTDFIQGDSENDILFGGLGDDTLKGDGTDNPTIVGEVFTLPEFHGNDYLDGEAGNDLLTGDGGSDELIGGTGNDTLQGDAANLAEVYHGADYLDGGDGNDRLIGGGKNDQLFGGTGDDELEGDSSDVAFNLHGNDYLDGEAGQDILAGSGGNDELFGGEDNDQLFGDSDDTPLANQGDDYLDGEAGNDYLRGYAGNDQLFGGEGNDELLAEAGDDLLDGESGEDILDAGEGKDILYGGAGQDELNGGLGNDELNGGSEIDILSGGEGDDTLDGGEHNDNLYGGKGNDTYIYGLNSGDDIIWEFEPDVIGNIDTIKFGTDILPSEVIVQRGFKDLVFNVRHFNGQFTTNQNLIVKDFFKSGTDNFKIERVEFADGTVWNSSQLQILAGNTPTSGNDTLIGYDDTNDVISSLAGNDRLEGLNGNDTLDGGAGRDDLIGGEGNDTYLLNRASGTDTIMEINGANPGFDTLQLAADIAPTDVSLHQHDGRLVLTVNGTNTPGGASAQFWINSFFNAAANQIEQIKFNDGTIWNLAEINARTIKGTENTLTGTSGNDTFIVDNTSDLIVEGANQGTDTVQSWVSYNLPTNIENITFTESLSVSSMGNALNNMMTGNSGDNALSGQDGNDTLIGNAGDDYLNGGTGNDNMSGGRGDDTYVIDNVSDTVTENTNEGIDTVQSSVSYTLSANVENLTLTGSDFISGTGNALDNIIIGNTSIGTIDGGAGADTMIGGVGGNTYIVDNIGDKVIESTSDSINIDTIKTSVSYTLPANVEKIILTGATAINATGNELNNTLDGSQNSAANVLTGGKGDDTYIISGGDTVVENSNEGSDTVQIATGVQGSYTLASFTNIENLTLNDNVNASNLTGDVTNNILNGNISANVLMGGDGDDQLFGWDGHDTLDGGTGSDQMTGWAGADTYIVDNINDVVIEAGFSDIDTVMSSISYTLGTNVEKLILSGTSNIDATGNTLSNNLIGNSGINQMSGESGADQLEGAAGNDTLMGGTGGDLYVFNLGDGQDTIIENDITANLDEIVFRTPITPSNVDLEQIGNDLIIQYSASDKITVKDWFIDNTHRIERIVFSDGTTWNSQTIDAILTGVITGTNGDDNLIGTTQDDTLMGLGGNDTLDGKQGADNMQGGTGNDIYFIDNIGDVVTENASEGTDTVNSAITYTLGANLENLTLNGTAAINAIGNSLNNTLQGNSADNRLDGGTGNDTMRGAAGNDTYVVNVSGDVIVENASEGTDTVESSVTYTLGSNVENLILIGTSAINGTGNSLNNVLTGNSAVNTLSGGTGNDTYIISSGDIVTENSSAGTDTVVADFSYTLGTNLENLTLSGSANINGTGNSAANTIIGNAGNNAINGGSGADSLRGGLGNDTYTVDNTSDVIVENANEGTDLVNSSVTYTLSANVENITLSGTSAINATGNTSDNVITGNSAINTLTGGAGNDTLDGLGGNDALRGGTGDDTYIFGTGDTITENANEGTDTVRTGATFTLGSNLENLILTGTAVINGTGNTLNNVITGNSANNTLTGNAGNDTLNGNGGTDTLRGGTGDDIYFVDGTSDIVTENASEGTDTVNSSVTLTLGSNVENLNLSGTGAINGTGNTLNNVINGNSGNNVLTGNAGADTLAGGAGTDTLNGGTGNDIYKLGRGDGADTVIDNDTTSGNQDKAQFGTNITKEQLWLQQVGNNLKISIMGTADSLTIQDFYSGPQHKVERIETFDGHALLASQAHNLVQAMASFDPPSMGQTTLPPEYEADLLPVIAANWT